MFNSIFSRVRNVLGTSPTKLSTPRSPQPAPAPAPAPQPSVQPKPPAPAPKPQPISQEAQLKMDRLLDDLKRRETALTKRLLALEEKESYLRRKQEELDQKNDRLTSQIQEIEKLKVKQLEKLEEIADLSQEKAKDLILKQTEKRLSDWIAKKIDESRDILKAKEDEEAKEIFVNAMRHGVTDYVGEYTVSTISLPNEDIKGKIIGREGRNIRAFERATGVELELDETNDIRLSSFDPVRREIAKIALEKLIKDGRIQPVKIEDIIKQTRLQMDKILLDEGRKISQEVGVYQLPIELLKLIGKFKFRFSYGQNLAIHTIEETKIGVALAHELGADVKTVRLACLLHDIGKVIVDEEGTHVQLGVDLLRRFHVPEAVINAVSEHHEDKPFSSTESIIVWIADAASGSRPGARYEAHEEYVKRLSSIEETAKSFEGVTDVAAYQAGREVRVIVDPGKVTDSEAKVLAQKVAEKLDEEAKWAGQIKVTVIRENRFAHTVVPTRETKDR
jgi:ribonucrease Y